MKTLRLFSLTGIVLSVSLIGLIAGGNESLDKVYNQLNAQMKAVVKQISTEANVNEINSAFLVVSFSVNNRSEIENVSIESSDEKLADRLKKELSKAKIKVNPMLEGKCGQVVIEI